MLCLRYEDIRYNVTVTPPATLLRGPNDSPDHTDAPSDYHKQQVAGLFSELATLIGKNLAEDGPGVFTIPDLLQIKVVRKPATEEHKGINPFTKEEMVIKAKPATNTVKVVPLKGLKGMV